MVTLVKHDLEFILKQIEIAEAHAAGGDLAALVAGYGGNDGLAQAHLLPYGLRTVDGSYNNLLPGRENWGASDQSFPGLFTPTYLDDDDGDRYDFNPLPNMETWYTNNDYANAGTNSGSQPGPGSGTVIDADPRIISNLVVDQTLNNPAAIAAALTLAGVPNEQLYEILGQIVDAKRAVDAASAGNATPQDIANLEAAVEAAEAALAQASAGAVALIAAAADDQALLTAAEGALATAQTAATQAVAAVAALLTDNIPNADQGTAFADAIAHSDLMQAALVTAQANVTSASTNAAASAQALADVVGPATNALADAQADLDAALETTSDLDVAQSHLTALLGAYGVEMDDNTIFLPNVSPDEGLSSPFNGWMTIFGQFFDHGLDLVAKGGNGTVYVPLSPDDPMYVPGGQNYIPLTRVTVNPGADGILGTADDGAGPKNLTTPWVDQNQTYASTASKQVFMREYIAGPDGKPIASGLLLEGTNGGLATWADIKKQAADVLGIKLTDLNVGNIPLVASDEYGNFIPGANGYPQLVVNLGPDGILGTADDVLREGNPASPVSAQGVAVTGHAFLDDIAHAAVPVISGGALRPDDDAALGYSGGMVQLAIGSPPVLQFDVNGDPIMVRSLDNGRGGQTFYDNELLDRHFIAGDGRVNENIALTAVHQVFHSEHNRIVEMTKQIALDSGDLNFLNQWLLVDVAAIPTTQAEINALVWDGERLFQVGRFTNEMEYQHLVFEEFGRMMQPDIDAFVFEPSADINPSIAAEFAHVVYRFGHSMLRQDIAVIQMDEDGRPIQNDITLFEGFLNPIKYDSLGSAEEASGAIIRGMSRQVGSAIDEFVTDVLRNQLLGIPLDLATINLARGRDVGTPPLNVGRQKFYDETGDTLLKPYTSWADFALNLMNPASIINFIAAYGTHETLINNEANPKTIEQLREAATLLVLGGDGAPADRLDFLNATGAYAGGKLGGLNDVDFWIGGLAEKKMAFGGMLGSTFAFVFQMTMENLQDADRFYYLSRTQGLNLLNELENNTFAELVMRNTDLGDDHSTALPGNLFSAFEMPTLEMDPSKQLDEDPTQDNPYLPFANIVERRDAAGNLIAAGDTTTVAAYIRVNSNEHFTIGGTEGNDTIVSGGGDDAIWGKGGDDRIEAGYGVDKVFGGEGDDIITNAGTDIGEADFLHGNEGNDVIHGGSGLSLIFGNQGNDFLIAGPDGKEIFGGTGNDFILGGTGGDFLLGNEGNDWIEGGDRFDTLAGENSELFFNSSIVGHDVLLGGGGDTDYDAESGDDIMSQNSEGIQRSNGMAGFDWAIHKGDSQAANSDLGIPIFETQEAFILRDRFDLVEGLSGWDKNDTLTGRNVAVNTRAEAEGTAAIPNAGSALDSYSNALLEKNVDLITGLRALVAHITRTNQTGANGVVESVVLETADASDILLGGGGSDTIKGLAGNDVIDGDMWLNVRIIGTSKLGTSFSADYMESPVTLYRNTQGQLVPASTPNAIAVTKPLTTWMLEGAINPGALSIVREIVNGNVTGDFDRAVYTDIRTNYSFGLNSDDSLFIDHSGFVQPQNDDDLPEQEEGTPNLRSDGKDTFRNIELLSFSENRFLNVIEGTSANETLTGTITDIGFGRDDLISGRDGNDTLNGGVGDDVLLGGDGADTLNGGDGNDILIGGKDGTTTTTTTSTYADNFNTTSFGNSTGGTNWGPDWVETGDDNSDDSGQIQIDEAINNALGFVAGNGAQIQRTVNLAGATSATLSYSIVESGLDENDDSLTVYFSRTGLEADFVQVDLINNSTNTVNRSINLNLFGSGEFTANAAIRFVASSYEGTDSVAIDNLSISFTTSTTNTAGDLLNGGNGDDTYVINLGDGSDVITESSGTDRIVIGAGVLTGLTAFSGASNDLVLQFNGQQVTVNDHYDSAGEVVETINLDGTTYEGYAFDGDYALSTDDNGDREAAAGVNTLLAGSTGSNELIGADGGDLLFGHDGNDTLLGGTGDDLLVGGSGDDELDGEAGADTMVGGAGNDIYIVDDAGDVVVEAGGGGIDEVQTDLAAYTLSANVEDLTYTGAGTFTGTGNALDNVIEGGAGVDTLTGLGGNDTYLVTAGDVVVEAENGGTDTIVSAASYVLGANLENLSLTGNADGINGTGNALDNVLTGNGGTNQLFGGAGNDTINGGDDADFIDGGSGNDILHGGAGNDTDILIGGEGNDTIYLNTNSGITNDGNDIIRYTAANFGDDTIHGFDANANGGQDQIDLSALGVTAANFNSRVFESASGADTILTIRENGPASTILGTIRIAGVSNANIDATDFILASAPPALVINGTDAGQTTNAGNSAETIYANGGNDTVNANGGNDVVFGGEGADTLNGGDGNDTLSGGLGMANGTMVDNFLSASYSNNNGNVNFAGNWSENSDNGGATGGDILITGGRLTFASGTDNNDSIQRAINLTGATAPTLSFDYQAVGLDTGETVVVQALNGSTWDTLGTLGGNATSSFSSPLNPAHSAIRFVATGGFETGESFHIDNVVVALGPNSGVDTINGNAGDDTIIWNANNTGPTDGFDIVDGGTEGTAGDTFVVNGNGAVETYRIYTKAAAAAAGFASAALTEIVITRHVGLAAAVVIAELREIEEIRINGVDPADNTTASGDTVEIIGDFSATSLRLNTITIDGDAGDDTIDISATSPMAARRSSMTKTMMRMTATKTITAQATMTTTGTTKTTTTMMRLMSVVRYLGRRRMMSCSGLRVATWCSALPARTTSSPMPG
ncbi:peroxidase family protein [Devosia riboflavina]|uniref:peroxidase family protein n=1 Tax=Devosia riboflavina TaxID=46914 RepID=UPI00068FE714|nr:peroxidase family protein [Devosia riboflavina]